MSRLGPEPGRSFDDVLEAAASGNARAFGFLFDSLQGRVRAFAEIRGASDPEGFVNEVFLRVFRNLVAFDGNEAQFKAWVFRIARNRLIDEHRRRQRRPLEGLLDDAASDRLIAPDLTEEAALGRVGSQALLELVDGLTPDQRDVVLLRTVADLTIDAIAEILGKPPGAVKALQRRALRSLAREISTESRTDFVRSHVPGGCHG